MPASKANYHLIEKVNGSQSEILISDIKSGCILRKESYEGSKPVGVWVTKDENCKVVSERDFSLLEYIDINSCNECYAQYGAVYDTTVVSASFKGGEAQLFQYLGKKIRYPSEALDAGVSGVLYATLLIDKEGKVSNVRILKSVNPFLDYEAYRVISNMPTWNPATLNGEPVAIQYNLPIRFSLR